jgi:hypothetical protein
MVAALPYRMTVTGGDVRAGGERGQGRQPGAPGAGPVPPAGADGAGHAGGVLAQSGSRDDLAGQLAQFLTGIGPHPDGMDVAAGRASASMAVIRRASHSREAEVVP